MKDSFLKLENLAEETEVDSYRGYNHSTCDTGNVDFSRIIVTLYPPNEGYSVSIYSKDHPGFNFDTGLIPYDEYEFLECIDNRELPFMILDILDELGINLFSSGVLHAELRDCRENPNISTCPKEFVVLKPTLQSIVHELAMCCGEDVSEEEKNLIESRLLRILSGPLDLEVKPGNDWESEDEDDSGEQDSPKFRLSDIRFSVIKKRRLEWDAPPGLRLYDFLKKRKEAKPSSSSQRQHLRRKEYFPPFWMENPSEIVPPNEIVDVVQFAKVQDRPAETTDSGLVPLEEYIFEADKGPQGQGRIYLVRLTILHRRATDEFVGELYVDRDYKENNPSNGSLCRFPLGPRGMVNKYIHQFTEIFTEEGRKSVKITHNMPNQPPRVMCTFAMKEQKLKQEQALQQQQQQAAQPTADPAQPVLPAANTMQETVQSVNTVPPPNVTVTQASEIPSIASTQQPRMGQPLTRQALIENLKSGQLTPPISALLTSLINSGQLQRTPSGGLAIAKPGGQSTSGGEEGVRIVLPQSVQIQNQQVPGVQQPSGGTVTAPIRGIVPRPTRPANLASLLATRNASLTDSMRGHRSVSPGSPRLTGATSPRPIVAHSPMVRTPATPRPEDVVLAIDPPVSSDSGINTLNGQKGIKPELQSPVTPQQPNPTLNSLLAGSPHSVTPDPNSVLERLSSPPSISSRASSAASLLSPRTIGPVSTPLGSGQRVAVQKRQQPIIQSTGPPSTSSDPGSMMNLQDGNTGNLQNVQVSIPGLSMPLSLQIAMPEEGSSPDQQGQTMVLQPHTSQPQRLASLKTTQGNQTTVLLVGPRPGSVGQSQGQSIALPVSLLQLPKSQAQGTRPIGQIRTSLIRQPQPGGSNVRQINSQNLTTHQQLQLALQRHAAQKLQQQQRATTEQHGKLS
ncbi:mucin-2-like isoform X2 [Artemia franciscana]|uniref:mucin-2-like isoform X2 n=1 Tax=Artemia franciscana TaxID=6661 RepID=UPI0032DA1E6B